MESFYKLVCPGKANHSATASSFVFVEINYEDGRLSITGVHGPLRSGNAKGGCGQLDLLELQPFEFEKEWNQEMLNMLAAIWKRYHLNDVCAGSPAQEFYLNHNPINDRLNFFDKASEALEAAGLNPDPHHIVNGKPYRYGSAWLSGSVPEWVLEWLYNLPETNNNFPAPWKKA